MDRFENGLVLKEEEYHNGLFPKIPQFNKSGSAFVLTGGMKDDILINAHTTTRDIRNGKYTKLVEISTFSYVKDICFASPSKEAAYSFDISVRAVIQVADPIVYYQNRNLDVDIYFNNLFSLDVKKITKNYSILAYEGLDEELTKKLSSYNTMDEATGFSYQISAVNAIPGKDAQPYVQKYSQLQLNEGLKNNAKKLALSYQTTYEEAVWTAVAEGKMSQIEAITKIKEYNDGLFEDKVEKIESLRDKGILTDVQMKQLLIPEVGENFSASMLEDMKPNDRPGLSNFYTEEEG